jgi:L-seryl-tRNA(Ser) seleniumtransferase
LSNGQRGRRGDGVAGLICQVTGAEDALVVNNCAAATILMLSAIASNRAVVISRGQLVEIGGGFRIPDIMAQSGARLIEVGTTNRTHLADYEQALRGNPDVRALLRVHSSNFRMLGFTSSVSVAEMVQLARTAPGPVDVLDDIGSGALLDTQQFGLSHEPMPQESLRDGVAIVTFSGDKLLGGPQAGILAGKHAAIERCRSHPLARAFRVDKYTLSALGATLMHYLRGEAQQEVPVWRMIAMPKGQVNSRAACFVQDMHSWLTRHGLTADLVDGVSAIGGGSVPGGTLPTSLVALRTAQPNKLAAAMRAATVPIIARIQDDSVVLDLRTVLDDQALINSLNSINGI